MTPGVREWYHHTTKPVTGVSLQSWHPHELRPRQYRAPSLGESWGASSDRGLGGKGARAARQAVISTMGGLFARSHPLSIRPGSMPVIPYPGHSTKPFCSGLGRVLPHRSNPHLPIMAALSAMALPSFPLPRVSFPVCSQVPTAVGLKLASGQVSFTLERKQLYRFRGRAAECHM